MVGTLGIFNIISKCVDLGEMGVDSGYDRLNGYRFVGLGCVVVDQVWALLGFLGFDDLFIFGPAWYFGLGLDLVVV